MSEDIRVENPNGDDFEFEGELVVDEQHSDIGFVKVWRTRGGRFVLRQKRARRPGIFDVDRTAKAETVKELSEILGHTPGAKSVVRQLGMSRSQRLD